MKFAMGSELHDEELHLELLNGSMASKAGLTGIELVPERSLPVDILLPRRLSLEPGTLLQVDILLPCRLSLEPDTLLHVEIFLADFPLLQTHRRTKNAFVHDDFD